MISAAVIGRISSDLELVEVGDTEVLNLRVTSQRPMADREGLRERTSIIYASIWGPRARTFAEQLRRGDHVALSGTMELTSDREGRPRLTLRVDRLELVE